jgi:hypothetical protein
MRQRSGTDALASLHPDIAVKEMVCGTPRYEEFLELTCTDDARAVRAPSARRVAYMRPSPHGRNVNKRPPLAQKTTVIGDCAHHNTRAWLTIAVSFQLRTAAPATCEAIIPGG